MTSEITPPPEDEDNAAVRAEIDSRRRVKRTTQKAESATDEDIAEALRVQILKQIEAGTLGAKEMASLMVQVQKNEELRLRLKLAELARKKPVNDAAKRLRRGARTALARHGLAPAGLDDEGDEDVT